MLRHAHETVAALAALALMVGCGGAPVAGARSAAAAQPQVVACATGEALTRAQLGEHMLEARAVYVGELHDRSAHHLAQRDIIALLHALDPSLAIGMEMFEHPYQAALDEFTSGATDEAQLLLATEWATRWTFDVSLYRPILSFARQEHLRILALNARRELTRAIAREGEEALTDEQRAELPAEMDRQDPEHRAMVMGLLGGHGGHGEHAMDEAMLERFYLAQLVWDETMGSRVAEALAAPDGPHRVVVLAGRVHVQGGLGIPRRAARRGATPSLVILPASAEELEGLGDACDYAWLVAAE